MAENYAAVLHGPYDVRIENIPVPEINEDEVLVKIDCVGICGSDVKLYTTGACGAVVVTQPIVIGHEGAGIVVKTGSRVTSLAVGDRVAIEPTQPCRACEYCKLGRYNLCAAPHYCSTIEASGNLCRYYKHVADFCYKMPDNLTMEEGAAVQPLAIAMHACNRAGIRLGQRVLILGAGPIGILCAMTARAMGASKIIITDVVQCRLDTAREMGADYTFLVKKDYSDKDMVDGIVELLGCEPEVTIDACAFASAQRVAMLVTKKGGVVLVVGIGDTTVEVPLTQALLREVDVRGSLRIVNTYPPAIAAVSSGAIDLKKFITHHFSLQQTREALELAKSGDAMKIIIHVQTLLTFISTHPRIPRSQPEAYSLSPEINFQSQSKSRSFVFVGWANSIVDWLQTKIQPKIDYYFRAYKTLRRACNKDHPSRRVFVRRPRGRQTASRSKTCFGL